jgi:hypothetical protein
MFIYIMMMQFHTVISVPGVVWDVLLFLCKLKNQILWFDSRALSDTCWLVKVNKLQLVSMCLNMLHCEATSISLFKLRSTNEWLYWTSFLSVFPQDAAVCNCSDPLWHRHIGGAQDADSCTVFHRQQVSVVHSDSVKMAPKTILHV